MKRKKLGTYITKSFLPPLSEYEDYLKIIWASGQLTNQGRLLREFEKLSKDYLGVKYFHFVANGTLAIQVAMRALGIVGGEVITTPFSYVATTSAILWERCKPIFVDIDINTLCIDARKIEEVITPNTKAILAVHVFGYPCEVEKINFIAKKHNLKVLYDGAHAFGVEYNNKSIFNYGDISTCSFHATKSFHTIEGGCIIPSDLATSEDIELMIRFGHRADDHKMLGINAKANEFQAAMGLCNLKYIDKVTSNRREVTELYDSLLSRTIWRPVTKNNIKYNYAYYPVVFESPRQRRLAVEKLNRDNVYPRRYFYPSLNRLPYLEETRTCPNSESIASRILCLPLFSGLTEDKVKEISSIVKKVSSAT